LGAVISAFFRFAGAEVVNITS